MIKEKVSNHKGTPMCLKFSYMNTNKETTIVIGKKIIIKHFKPSFYTLSIIWQNPQQIAFIGGYTNTIIKKKNRITAILKITTIKKAGSSRISFTKNAIILPKQVVVSIPFKQSHGL